MHVRGELTKLGWGDIDFDRRTAYVATTKNGQPKVLPLTDSVIKELQVFDTKDSSLIFASKIKLLSLLLNNCNALITESVRGSTLGWPFLVVAT